MSLDDVPETLLEGAVAAIGVRVEPLHKGLVLGLDGRPVRGLVEAQHVEGAADRAGIAGLLRLFRRTAPGLPEILSVEDAERIDIGPVARRGPLGPSEGLTAPLTPMAQVGR